LPWLFLILKVSFRPEDIQEDINAFKPIDLYNLVGEYPMDIFESTEIMVHDDLEMAAFDDSIRNTRMKLREAINDRTESDHRIGCFAVSAIASSMYLYAMPALVISNLLGMEDYGLRHSTIYLAGIVPISIVTSGIMEYVRRRNAKEINSILFGELRSSAPDIYREVSEDAVRDTSARNNRRNPDLMIATALRSSHPAKFSQLLRDAAIEHSGRARLKIS
jgi:hypothetical protein